MTPDKKEIDKKLCQFIIDKNSRLKEVKIPWEPHWKELVTYFLPDKNDIWGGRMPGEKKGAELFDSIGRRCAERLASALHGMLTNPSVQWFGFTTGIASEDLVQENAKWLQEVGKITNAVLNNSNFQSEIHEVYIDLTAIHTSHLRIEEDPIEVVRFKSRPIYECAIAENYKGVIDTVHYEYKRTLDQLFDEFRDKLPEKLRDMRLKDPMKEFTIIQAIEPSDRMPEGLKHPMLPFTSVHILKEEYVVLKVAGFEENPCIISRFYKLSGEMYGRGPSMYALPDVKTCDQMMKVWLEGAQLAINPPLQMPDEGVLLPIRFVPGGTNYYRADSKDRIEPIITGANPQIGEKIIELLHDNVRNAFYIDQLHLVENDRMTKAEVDQRRDEYLRTFSPILGRLMYELHGPLLMRVFGICMRRGLYPPMPAGMAGKKLEIKFVSQLARAQDSIDGDAALRAFQVAAGFIQLDPSAGIILDLDKHIKFIYKSFGAPLDLLRSDKEAKDIRDQQAQAQQEAHDAEVGKMQSEGIKNTAQAQAITP